MTEYYKQRDNCRLCESKNLKLCFKLEPTPPANAFIWIRTKDFRKTN